MLKLLLKKQLTEVFKGYFYNAKKNKKRSKVGVVLYFILFGAIMIGLLGGIFTALSLALCGSLRRRLPGFDRTCSRPSAAGHRCPASGRLPNHRGSRSIVRHGRSPAGHSAHRDGALSCLPHRCPGAFDGGASESLRDNDPGGDRL